MPSQRSAMRFARLGALLALTAFPLSSPGDEPVATTELNWRTDYANALAEAHATDRLVWIQFTGSWCPNCVRMERESFIDPSIIARARSEFVAVKLQADVEDELASAFDLTGLPATVVVDPSRTVLAVHQGYLGPSDLDRFLSRLVSARPPRFHVEDQRDGLQAAVRLGGSSKSPILSAAESTEAVAVSGCCLVSLVLDRKLTPGRSEFTTSYRGRTYRFADETKLNLFRGAPGRYLPAIDGVCPVSRLDEGGTTSGDPRYGALYNGRLYLCASQTDRERFFQDPERYGAVGVEQGGDCPHCLAADGHRVPGDPRFSLVDGRRWYWFPDESHRSAFMALAPPPRIRR